MSHQVRRISRGRRLTTEEAAKYRKMREQIELEKPALIAEINNELAQLAELDTVFAELKNCREAKGLSLSDVQELTDIDRSVISKLERVKRTPCTIESVRRYANALGRKVVISLVAR